MPQLASVPEVALRLTKVQGQTVLHKDDVVIYRVELHRHGVFEKFLFLPNDAIPIYGMRTWQHRDAIPQELLKMVRRLSRRQQDRALSGEAGSAHEACRWCVGPPP
jgi:hypothetical protein